MNSIQPWHLLLLAIALVVLFGSKRLPDAARGLGRSLRILKSEMKEMTSDGDAKTVTSEAAELPAPKPVVPPKSEPAAEHADPRSA